MFISNILLFFYVQRGEIKLAQLDMLLKHLTFLRQEHKPMLPVLLSGDFNLAPHSPLYHFLSSGELDASGLSRYGLSGQNLDTYALKVIFLLVGDNRSDNNANCTCTLSG